MRAARMLLLLFCSAVFATEPMYRCPGPNGEVLFTNRPCDGGEEYAPPAPNVVGAADSAYHYERTPEPAGEPGAGRSATRITDCDNAAELRRIDLMLKSLRADKRQQAFLKAERRRVARCAHENLSAAERQRRAAALRRTGSLRGTQRTEAEAEIEDLYGAGRSTPRKKKR